jgi:hypothetical protein
MKADTVFVKQKLVLAKKKNTYIKTTYLHIKHDKSRFKSHHH